VFEVAESGYYLASAVLFSNRYQKYLDEFEAAAEAG
jgi:hypothetical protein